MRTFCHHSRFCILVTEYENGCLELEPSLNLLVLEFVFLLSIVAVHVDLSNASKRTNLKDLGSDVLLPLQSIAWSEQLDCINEA